jgi:hypothetical protein
MKFEPGSFYFGVVDFFSIMLPGGLLAYFLHNRVASEQFNTLFNLTEGVKDSTGWVMFLFAAYLFGHIVFLVGSYLDKIYDSIRKMIWPKESDYAFREAEALKIKSLGKINAKAINTYQWSRATLTLNYPEGMADVARLEADSKFFRSLVVVLFVLVAYSIKEGGIILGILLVLTVLSYWRYTERRYKSTEQAYRYMIVASINNLEKK